MIGSRKITVQFRVNWLIAVIALGAVLITAYVFVPDSMRPLLIFTVSVLVGAGALIAAFNALDSRYAQLRQSKAEAALDFILCWNAPTFFHAKMSVRETLHGLKGRNTSQEQHAYLDQDPMRLANFTDVFNFFEAMSIAIQADIADEKTAKQFFRSILVEYWNGAEGFIRRRRTERNNARLLRETEWLYDRWKS